MIIKLIEIDVNNEIYNMITCTVVPPSDVNTVISEFIADRLHGMVLRIDCKIVDVCKYEMVVKTTVNS